MSIECQKLEKSGSHPRRRKKTQNRIISLICPFLPPRVFAKYLPIKGMVGRGCGDRTNVSWKAIGPGRGAR